MPPWGGGYTDTWRLSEVLSDGEENSLATDEHGVNGLRIKGPGRRKSSREMHPFGFKGQIAVLSGPSKPLHDYILGGTNGASTFLREDLLSFFL